jgi:hypothetical protein
MHFILLNWIVTLSDISVCLVVVFVSSLKHTDALHWLWIPMFVTFFSLSQLITNFEILLHSKRFRTDPLIFCMAQQPVVDRGLIMEASRSHSDTPHSVGHLWTGDQPVAETSTWQHSQLTDIHALGGIRTRNPIKLEATDPRHRPHGHCNRRYPDLTILTLCCLASPIQLGRFLLRIY